MELPHGIKPWPLTYQVSALITRCDRSMVGIRGVEPRASRPPAERSTDELDPVASCMGAATMTVGTADLALVDLRYNLRPAGSSMHEI